MSRYTDPDAPPSTKELAPRFHSEQDRLQSFARALDALHAEMEQVLGEVDIAHIRHVRRTSQRLQLLGRGLLHFSFEPVSWGLGVVALSGHKLLELIEIGHTVLHGTYDQFDTGEEFHSRAFIWRAPIDEASWRSHHNLRHHQFTNVADRDPDLDFGALRLGAGVPFRAVHRLQPLSNLITWAYFSAAINAHVTGLIAWYAGRPQRPVVPGKTASAWSIHRRAFGKFGRYFAREYLLFPLLAGPFGAKVLLGNMASELVRDAYAAATIYCGHVGATEFPAGTRAKGRAEWYRMQVEGSRDFEVGPLVSVLCGGLERQIEHHLFPRLPPNRLREIAPRVRAICEEHGVNYRSDSWPHVLRDVFRRLTDLGSSAPVHAPGFARAQN
jgi:linoleoyl-CoA desaturase